MDGATVARTVVRAATGEQVEEVELLQQKGHIQEFVVTTDSGREITVSVNIFTGKGMIVEQGRESMGYSTFVKFDD